MGLKALVKSLDEVPETLRDLYVQIGDEFVLDVEDKDFKSQLQEFRTNNIDLTKQNRELAGAAEEAQALRAQVEKYKDIDPERAREAMQKMQQIEEKKLIDAGNLDEVVNQRLEQRVEAMRADYDGKLNATTAALEKAKQASDNYKSRLSEVVIDNSLQQAISKVAAPRPGAIRDILSRGRDSWRLDDDGKPIPYDSAGDVLYGKDGKQPLTMEEWAQGLAREAAYLFEPNAGGGAPGNSGTGDGDTMVVDSTDQDTINANIENIAEGRVAVRT